MNISHLNIGIIHSLVGKNDGVSIVIDQSVEAMIKYMKSPLGNIHFLAAHSSPRFNTDTDDVFWHKSKVHKQIIKEFSCKPSSGLNKLIHENALYAKKVITEFIEKYQIDLLIAHNTSHPYNFITAVGLGYYIEEQRLNGIFWPKTLVWWHDSYYERKNFRKPNSVIKKYLKYLPGTNIDGLLFINNSQPEYARKMFKQYLPDKDLKEFFRKRTSVIFNTCDINWKWKGQNWESKALVAPPQDKYNENFFKDIGLLEQLQERKMKLDDTVILLQHTRVVARKKIELAVDFAFRLEKKFRREKIPKCVAVLVSGHSGDEQEKYRKTIKQFYKNESKQHKKANVILIFGEKHILSHRDIIVDRKYYKFSEIPSIIAATGGIGTYFSEVEGFGNNLLEMISCGLPVVINKYDIYSSDIEPLGFQLPSISECRLNKRIVDEAFELLTDLKQRNQMVKHNLKILDKKLSHKLIARKLEPLIKNIFYSKPL